MYIDTHTHLYLDKFDEDRSEMIQRAVDNNVTKILLPNIDGNSFSKMEKMVTDFPGICYSMIGIHPCDVIKNWEKQLEQIKQLFVKNQHVGIGEIGIDLYWDKSLKEEQLAMFRAQVKWAKEEKLPVSIHCRDAFDEIATILEEENNDNLTGVLHCFTGNEEQANHIINLGGFKLGIGGIVTFKNAGLDATLKLISLEHLVLETDAPFLAPVPKRGKRNESAFIPFIAEKLATIYEIDVTDVEKTTTENALSIFKRVHE